MSRFEYLSVLISIVIALGISDLVSSWGVLLQRRARVRFYWVHIVWTVFLVLLMVEFWWGFWNFRVVEAWSFGALAAVVAEAIVLVLMAIVLTPRPTDEEPIDLRSHYYAQSGLVFGLGCVLLVQLALVDAWVSGQPFIHPENAVRGLGLGIAAWGAISKSERVHQVLAVAGSLLFGVFLSVTLMW